MKINTLKKWIMMAIAFILIINQTAIIFADERVDLIEERKAQAPDSNSIENWPAGPGIGAETACLMDANTGTILYAKDMDKTEYPASTTKVMTCLLAAENCAMDEMVTFSKEAVYGIERDSSNVGMDVGQSITMEQAIYCVMLASANEVASAIAEHVAGSTEAFADMMNKKAVELGCTNTHFVNANGLHNDEHYTTAHDLALITAAYFKNEQLRKIASTTYYEMHATNTQPDEFGIANHHKMLPKRTYAYDGFVGGKTGYTIAARQTLVSCAEKNGMTLVCAVMRDEAPYQYKDTAELFDYGFANFYRLNIADNEHNYSIDNANFFDTDIDIFGNSNTVFTIATDDFITLPLNVGFDNTESSLEYNDEDKEILANLIYSYKGVQVGTGHLLLSSPNVTSFAFGAEPTKQKTTLADERAKSGINVVFVNIKPVLIGLAVVLVLVFIIFLLQAILRNFNFARRRRKNILKRNKRYKSEFDDFDF